jgi:rhodanese-related sulfurtransferase
LIYVIALMISVAFAFSSPLAMAKDMTKEDFVADANKNITQISVSDAKALLGKAGIIFLDARVPGEYEAGHVPGAMNLPRGLLEFKIAEMIPDKNAAIVVYCKTGGRGSLATLTLGKMGYKNVKNMDGGWKAWEIAGYPKE